MNDNLFNFIADKTLEIMENTFSDDLIEESFKTQLKISHVIPIRHRVLGGLYQAVNIKFGNFLEILVKEIIKNDDNYTLVSSINTSLPIENKNFLNKLGIKSFSSENKVIGGSNTLFIISDRNQRLIDNYITECTKSTADKENVEINFKKLLKQIEINIKEEKENPNIYDFVTFNNDVDLLFFKNKNNHYYYVELKKEDNHDSGKTKDMYKKVIKTFVCLLYQEYSNQNKNFKIEALTPILLFFGNIKNQSNILPASNVYSGESFFNEYLTISFNEINNKMCKVSNLEKINDYLKNRVEYILNYDQKKLKNLLIEIIDEEIKNNPDTKIKFKEITKYNELIQRIDIVLKSNKITKSDIKYLNKRLNVISEKNDYELTLESISSLKGIKLFCIDKIKIKENEILDIKEKLKIKYNFDILE